MSWQLHVLSSDSTSADYVRQSKCTCISVCVSIVYIIWMPVYVSFIKIYIIDRILNKLLRCWWHLYLSSESSYIIALLSHPTITLMNKLKLLPCKVLLNKYSKILLVGQYLTHIFHCFALSATQKNLILMFIDFLKHEVFLFLAIFSAA